MRVQPASQLGVESFDIVSTYQVEIWRQRRPWRIEETSVHRVWIGAPHQSQGGNVVGGHHSRIRWMELARPAAPSQLGGDLVDALGDDQCRSIDRLGEKISEWSIEAPRQHYPLTILGYNGKGAIDAKNSVHITSEQPAPGFRFVACPEPLRFGGDQVDDARNGQVLIHAEKLVLQNPICQLVHRIEELIRET